MYDVIVIYKMNMKGKFLRRSIIFIFLMGLKILGKTI